jgi:hypothetical protein
LSFDGQEKDSWMTLFDAMLEGYLRPILEFEQDTIAATSMRCLTVDEVLSVFKIQQLSKQRFSKAEPILASEIEKELLRIQLEATEELLSMCY